MSTRRSIEGKMLRHLGMTAHAREALNAHNERQTDWHGWCRVCRTHATGTIAGLSAQCPKCGAGARDD